MLFERQRLLLTLLDAVGGPVGHTDFQKLLFLYTRDCATRPSLRFRALQVRRVLVYLL